jgi:hypothetical protein
LRMFLLAEIPAYLRIASSIKHLPPTPPEVKDLVASLLH